MACSVNMYFGESVTPQAGLKVFMSDGEPVQVDNYDITPLATALGLNFTNFQLTEGEILSCGSFTTWLQWNAVAQNQQALGYQAFVDIISMDFADFTKLVLAQFTTFLEGKGSDTLAQPTNAFTESEVEWAKLKQVYEYIKNIVDENYGRKYLIEIGDNNSGVCIKDRFGNAANFDLIAENDGGMFYTSDSPAPDGGWPNNNQVQILGLNIGGDTQTFQQGDFRLGCFVKFDTKENISKSFGGAANLFDLKLSSLDADSYYQKNDAVYLSATIANKIYQIDSKQYVLVELANKPELMLSLGNINNCGALAAINGCATLLTLFEGTSADTNDKLRQSLLCANCPPPNNGCDSQGGSNSDTTTFNIFNGNAPALIPDHFVLPMKSNVFVYGPWFYQANPVGGTQVEANRELKPWNFAGVGDDGYENMNYFGNIIAADGPRGLQSQENGSITVASLPNYTIGYLVAQNAATLTDIQMNVGSGGFSTSYNFQTYTPKFGTPGRHITNLWSKNYRRMSYLNKFFREQGKIINRIINATDAAQQIRLNRTSKGADTDPIVQGPRIGMSPGVYFFGGFRFQDLNDDSIPTTNASGGTNCYEGGGPSFPPACSKCESEDCYKDDSCELMDDPPELSDGNIITNRPWSNLQPSYTWEWANKSGDTFKNVAFMSVDMLLSPISTNQENGTKLPRLAMYRDYDCSDLEYSEKQDYTLDNPGRPPNSRSRLELPPFSITDKIGYQYNLPINQYYLNSVTSVAMLENWGTRKNGSDKGFITNVISYGDTAADFPFSLTEDDEEAKQEQTNFRYNVLKGPLTLQGWGYDTAGKPIPNAIDAAADTEQGKFRNKGLTDKFLQNWLDNPKTWPAGPIDLRWDRERGVWVAPPANKVVVARLLTNLSPNGVAEAELFDPEGGGSKFYQYYDIWDKDGTNVKSALSKTRIKVYDFLGVGLCKCDIVYAYYDDNRYIVLESSRAYQDPNQGCCVTTTPPETTQQQSTPSVATPTSCWCGLECLQSLDNYKAKQHQALVHTQTTGGEDCLVWEDIVECYTTPPANLIED